MKDEILEKMKKIVNQSEYIPQEVETIIEKIFSELEEVLCNNSNYASISKYLQIKISEVEDELSEIEETGKNAIVNDFDSIIVELNDLEKEPDDDIKNNYKEGISKLGNNNNEISINAEVIMKKVEEALMDIIEYQSKILDSVGYDPRKKEYMCDEIKDFINNMVSENEDEVYEIMQENAKQQSNKLLDLYEEFCQNLPKEEKDVDEKSSFRKSLDAGISLKKQLEKVKELKEKEQPKNDNLNQYYNLFR